MGLATNDEQQAAISGFEQGEKKNQPAYFEILRVLVSGHSSLVT